MNVRACSLPSTASGNARVATVLLPTRAACRERKRWPHRLLKVLWPLALAAPSLSFAQTYAWTGQQASETVASQKDVSDLAARVLHDLPADPSPANLEHRYRLELVAGQYGQALQTMAALRERLRHQEVIPTRASWVTVPYEIYADTRIKGASGHVDEVEAYGEAFRQHIGKLADWPAAEVARAYAETSPTELHARFQADLDAAKGRSQLDLADAIRLASDYLAATVFGQASRLATPHIEQDDARRYIRQDNILVKEANGSSVCAYVMRPKQAAPLPTLLEFTIYAASPQVIHARARLSAAKNYVGVLGFTRGKVCSPDKPSAYRNDADDASALIDWIGKQAWSDGRVGMYGGSYDGFTQWAAAKRMPKALKAIMPSTPVAPGIDVPMEGNVFWNFVYAWPFFTLDGKFNDTATYGDTQRWQKLDQAWYASGRAYRDLEKIDGTPNPTFSEWISHPSYDAYWQAMIPYQTEFSRVTIPVLLMAGYYYGGPGAAIYYFQQLEKYAPTSEHYLVMGPYHHLSVQYGVLDDRGNLIDTLAGLSIDPVAQLDMYDLRYQWFDYVFKRAPKPAMLADKVNYEVTGANIWKHAPSLATMSDTTRRFYLVGNPADNNKTVLSETAPTGKTASIPLIVNLADRSDANHAPVGGGVVDTSIDTANGLSFVSQPLEKPTEVSGLFSGRLDFMANKKDFDLAIDLYELTPQGRYVQLSPYWTRASYAADPTRRNLLVPGREQHLAVNGNHPMSRVLQPASRLVMVLRVIKESGRQINYGSGKDVSDESAADAAKPLVIRWLTTSHIDLPIQRDK
ncbi:CocE/NonD family hydrolase [Dyella choica]|uniref:CocE/NonD family hydrolase n=1 Tax=Dyella choica TaxID=1927959 RepID=A0A3S0S0K5_9GAMM|nr:CocE/NonD family hydrolase [Dyella choica]RUL76055.1 CocE/NonD family hydrolase [Dyella choica]